MTTTSRTKFNYSAIAVILLIAAACLVSCGKRQTAGQTIQNKGSDTLVQVAQAWAEQYSKVKEGVSVQVAGGGSGQGVKGLIDGTVQIANSSRAIKDQEREQIRQKHGKEVIEFIVGFDGIAVYTHKENPLTTISVEELRKIYADGGSYEEWNQVSAEMEGPIIRASRNNSSGTFVFFREAVCGKGNEFKKTGMVTQSGSKEVVDFIATTEKAIGYSGMGYKTEEVNWLAVSAAKGGQGYEPTLKNVQDGTYPIARPLFLYTVGKPEGAAREYIEWIVSEEGQKIVEAEGFVSLTPGQMQEQRASLD